MRLSLITNSPSPWTKKVAGLVSGYWVQNFVGTVADAKARAKEIEATNSNITIAVVDELPSPVSLLDYWENRRAL